MAKLYKLTDQKNRTQNNTLWGEGITVSKPPCENPRLCSGGVLHAYRNPNLAFLLNPIHANIRNPKLWEAEGEIQNSDWAKVGCFNLTTIKEIDKPVWVGGEKESLVRITFAVLCAEAVLHFFEDEFPEDNRVRAAIEAAKAYLDNPAAEAAEAAAWVAGAAVWAARAAAEAARAAAWAARAAVWAAWAAVWAAWAAEDIDFCLLADKAVQMIFKVVATEC